MQLGMRFRLSRTPRASASVGGNVIGTPSTAFDKLFGPYPSTEASITGGPSYIANWYSSWKTYELAQKATWQAGGGGVNGDWLYDPTLAYLGLYKVTGTASYLTDAKTYSDSMLTSLAYPSQALYNSYEWGTACRYALDSTPAGFVTNLTTDVETVIGGQYYWAFYCSNAADIDGGSYGVDGRSAARILDKVLAAHVLGATFTAANLYSGANGPSPKPGACANYAAVAESCVDAILANQDASGGWRFQYLGNATRYWKAFMNLLVCHSLYDYLRIIQPTAGGTRYNNVIAAMQACADALYTNGWISGNPANGNEEAWYYCFPAPGFVAVDDVPLPSGSDVRDLNVEIAWLYALMRYLGKTRSGSTPGTNDYGDIARRALIAATNECDSLRTGGGPANYAKQCHELGYRWHQTIYFLLNA